MTLKQQTLRNKISFRAQSSCKKQQQKSTEGNFCNITSKKCTISTAVSLSFIFFLEIS